MNGKQCLHDGSKREISINYDLMKNDIRNEEKENEY